MKKENNGSASAIKKYLTQKLKEENEPLNLSEMASYFDFNLQKNNSEFFQILKNSKIEIIKIYWEKFYIIYKHGTFCHMFNK